MPSIATIKTLEIDRTLFSSLGSDVQSLKCEQMNLIKRTCSFHQHFLYGQSMNFQFSFKFSRKRNLFIVVDSRDESGSQLIRMNEN